VPQEFCLSDRRAGDAAKEPGGEAWVREDMAVLAAGGEPCAGVEIGGG